METMIFADEVVPEDDLDGLPGRRGAEGLRARGRDGPAADRVARDRLRARASYKDEYREKVLELIEAQGRRARRSSSQPEAPAPAAGAGPDGRARGEPRRGPHRRREAQAQERQVRRAREGRSASSAARAPVSGTLAISRMPETGARPNVPRLQRGILRAIEALTTPLLPSDYLELINPLWSTRELRGRIERIEPETADAATVLIKPGYRWDGHQPGQYLRIGVDIKGRRHWRAYSLTSEPGRAGRLHLDHGQERRRGRGLALPRPPRPRRARSSRSAASRATSCSPSELPEKLLFISAGSGITPIMSMLRSARRPRRRGPAALRAHAGRRDLRRRAARLLDEHDGFRLHEQHTGEHGRMAPEHLDELCPDWRERETFVSGPGELLDALEEHWEAHGDRERLHLERFQPKLMPRGRGRGRHDRLPQERLRGRDRRHQADPRRRRGGRAGAALRLPRGHLPHLRRDAALRPLARPAQREGRRQRRRDRPHLHQRPRGTRRDRAVRRNAMENPLHRLTDEQIEALGREFDELHEEVKADLGDRDAAYIRGDHRAAPAARADRPRGAARRAPQARLGGRDGDALAGQDPREHGDRPQRPARPVGLDERPGDQLARPGTGTPRRPPRRGSTRTTTSTTRTRTSAARTGPRLRDHADRPAPAVAPGLPRCSRSTTWR